MAHVSHVLPDGRTLLDDVSFRIGNGVTAALVGPNGAGKTTLLRLVAGDLQPQSGTVTATGGLGVMRQFIGTNQGQDITPMVRDLLLHGYPLLTWSFRYRQALIAAARGAYDGAHTLTDEMLRWAAPRRIGLRQPWRLIMSGR